MYNRFTSYFLPGDKQIAAEIFRKNKLVINIIFITMLFELNYAAISIVIGLSEGAVILLFALLMHAFLLVAFKKDLSVIIATNLYLFFGVVAITVCIYFSGGFNSPVLPWLATSPIVALLMAGSASGMLWVIVNAITVITFGILSYNNFKFPVHYNESWANMLYITCYTGLVVIIFLIGLVFENGKNTALKKLAESSALLAEEKKKTALHNISQEIHDNIGVTLSVVKLNLHSLKEKEGKLLESRIEDTTELLTKAITDLRQISHSLYADNITDFNLIEAIKNELSLLSKTSLYNTRFKLQGRYYKLGSHTEVILFRVIQEIINNVIKHARAKAIDTIVSYEHGYLSIKISDDGIGFNCEELMHGGQGIRNMQERIRLIGGAFEIDSKINIGTVITIAFSLKPNTR